MFSSFFDLCAVYESVCLAGEVPRCPPMWDVTTGPSAIEQKRQKHKSSSPRGRQTTQRYTRPRKAAARHRAKPQRNIKHPPPSPFATTSELVTPGCAYAPSGATLILDISACRSRPSGRNDHTRWFELNRDRDANVTASRSRSRSSREPQDSHTIPKPL